MIQMKWVFFFPSIETDILLRIKKQSLSTNDLMWKNDRKQFSLEKYF